MKINTKYTEGDSAKILKKIKDGRFKLIVTSPPYNVGKEYETRKSITEYLESQKKIISELVRVLDDEGSICWQVGNYIKDGEVFPLDIYYYSIFKDFGLKLRNRIVWQFGHGLHAQKRFSGRYETVLWFSKSDNYTFNLDSVRVPSKYPGKRHFKGPKKGKLSGNPLGKNPSDMWSILLQDWENEVWNIPNVKSNHVEKTIHPCQYPIELIDRFILALTNEGDEVLDPFAGVGSTLISARKNNRHSLGIEMMTEYIKEGEKRLEALDKGELKMRDMTKPLYDHTSSRLSDYPNEFLNNEDI